MKVKARNRVGRVTVELLVANYGDLALARRGLLAEDKVRRQTISGIVDSAAARLVLPQGLVTQLGLPLGEKINIRYADGRRVQRLQAEDVYVEILGRHGTFTAIVEPRRRTALIGFIVLGDLDLLVDCLHQRLEPRDPAGPLYEIE